MGLTELIIAGASGAAATGGGVLMWRVVADMRRQRAFEDAYAEIEAEAMADIERHPVMVAHADFLMEEWRAGRAEASAVMAARNAQVRIEQRLIAAGYERHEDEGDAAKGYGA